VDGKIGAAFQESFFELFDEKAFAADVLEGAIDRAVPGGDDLELSDHQAGD
jgi:hypothetical protein